MLTPSAQHANPIHKQITGAVQRAARAAILALVFACCMVTSVAPQAPADEPAIFVGGQACAGCHAAETERWAGSHHALAMQKATSASVLGDFAGARLDHFGVVTSFSRSDDKFMVHTDGPDGALHDYEIAYTFGVYPLQQYLIAMPGGRLQALGVAWDARPKEQGGQRWMHLYPDQKLPAGDRLHWTGRDQTWNYQCADCHSTDLKKDYRPRHQHLRHQMDRRGRVLRVLPRAWLPSRRVGAGARGRGFKRDRAWSLGSGPAGPDQLAEGDRPGSLGDEPRDRHRQTHGTARIGGTRHLRRVPRAAQGDREGCRAKREVSRFVSPGAARARPLPRRRPDRRRGVRIRLLHAEPHASRGRHVFGLPRPAQPCAARRGQRALRPMPHAGKVRRGRASPSPTRQHRRAVRQLSYADEDLHGRGSQARSQLSCPAAGSVGVDRHAECVHPVPYRPARGLGRARDRRMVSAGPPDPVALRDCAERREDRRRRCGTTT